MIGRTDEADLILRHPAISRRHSRLIAEGENWFIEDLGTQNGTEVNGAVISRRTPLRLGDTIRIGPVILNFGTSVKPPINVPDDPTPSGTILVRGHPVGAIRLEAEMHFGRSANATVQLNDAAVSRLHATIKKGDAGYRITDLESRVGLFINGRRSFVHDLIIGDQIQIGPFHFLFDGRQLIRLHRLSVGLLIATDLERNAESGPILKKTSFLAEPGQFVGILGPSGSGKSTLLNALSGLRPADSGRILIDGTDYYKNFDALRSRVGHVPQDDIVHLELTVFEAFTFAARLRLPAGAPRSEIRSLVEHTVANLGLSDRAHLRISQLSGGQRKRVNVGVELLNRPLLLFLDEPTSGLDPFSEFKMMELLRKLADTGCTVVCTTHVVENIFLMDQIAVMTAGQLILQGSPDVVRTTFGLNRFSDLYGALQSVDPAKLPFSRTTPKVDLENKSHESRGFPAKRRLSFSLPILMARQTRLFQADLKNVAIALGQPLVIGAVVVWVTQEPPLVQFFTCLGTLWFGCSNSAQEIVKELPIFRRERLVGLSRASYLLSKFLWMGSLTVLQALALFAVTVLGEVGNKGDLWLQAAGLIVLAYSATGIGLAISTVARSAIQAVMLVPLVLIPQILFSGHTVETRNMSEPVRRASEVMPSYAVERIDDFSFFLHQKVPDQMDGFVIPYHNVNDVYRRRGYGFLEAGETIGESRPLGPLWLAFLVLAMWIVLGFSASYTLLARREKP